MRSESPAKLLRIHLSEGDREEGHPLYEIIVARCRELKIAGATVFRGLEGYGVSAELHRSHVMRHDQPIVITVVDTAENVARLVTEIEAITDSAVMVVSDVTAVRVQKQPDTHHAG